VCDNPIDFRHQGILNAKVWGDGEAEGVRTRAAEELKQTAVAARNLGVDTVVGFTGSSIWQYVAMFPPVSAEVIEKDKTVLVKQISRETLQIVTL
jgi:hypothetical protein